MGRILINYRVGKNYSAAASAVSSVPSSPSSSVNEPPLSALGIATEAIVTNGLVMISKLDGFKAPTFVDLPSFI
jgi:hypothetical protein